MPVHWCGQDNEWSIGHVVAVVTDPEYNGAVWVAHTWRLEVRLVKGEGRWPSKASYQTPFSSFCKPYKSLLVDLAWHCDTDTDHIHEDNRAPSWSWTSVGGSVTFRIINYLVSEIHMSLLLNLAICSIQLFATLRPKIRRQYYWQVIFMTWRINRTSETTQLQP